MSSRMLARPLQSSAGIMIRSSVMLPRALSLRPMLSLATRSLATAPSPGARFGKRAEPEVKLQDLKFDEELRIATYKTASGTRANVGDFFKAPQSFIKALPDSQLPNGMLRLNRLSDKESSAMLRHSTLDLIEMAEESVEKGLEGKALLVGKQGSGKTYTLFQLAVHFQSANWIVIYLPKLSQWTSASSFYYFNESTNQWDQPELTATVLESILSMNAKTLAEVKLAEPVQVGSKKVDDNLASLVKAGISSPQHSTLVLQALFKILKSQSPKVFVALDQVGSLFSSTAYRTPKSEPIMAHELSLCHEFQKLFLESSSSKNSFVIGTNDTTVVRIRSPYLQHYARTHVHRPLGRDPIQAPAQTHEAKFHTLDSAADAMLPSSLAPHHRDAFTISVVDLKPSIFTENKVVVCDLPVYSREETAAMLKFYKESSVAHFGFELNDHSIKRAHLLTGGNGRQLMNYIFSH
ncbi:mitochondrial ribosomal death-associated protein 3-domain-containing protein [Polychytrium aggregatum]|uniref:mitochondrial ribosomal death-associated protein 3-domain-containing protein n=1 Tax=Polychytrium aggregatum TaxID=110093 RepID=UPI0022FDC3A3|nr:mitochondrial ribosomal death-associated protein 3-domain-containing protein [Polychytrium aggregatum]KAI9205173.1 mitochondrial ribosomal death-associated protein 3-domain-containing protein [Polychytrium aggregatum]